MLMVARTPPPTVVHSAGIERVVITLGHKGTAVAEVIQQFDFVPMRIEYVWCEASSWKRGHASNILAARSMFSGTEPLLVVMSDQLYVRRRGASCSVSNFFRPSDDARTPGSAWRSLALRRSADRRAHARRTRGCCSRWPISSSRRRTTRRSCSTTRRR